MMTASAPATAEALARLCDALRDGGEPNPNHDLTITLTLALTVNLALNLALALPLTLTRRRIALAGRQQPWAARHGAARAT